MFENSIYSITALWQEKAEYKTKRTTEVLIQYFEVNGCCNSTYYNHTKQRVLSSTQKSIKINVISIGDSNKSLRRQSLFDALLKLKSCLKMFFIQYRFSPASIKN